MQKRSFVVTAAERDTLLIEYLAARLSLSRKKAKQLLDQRAVFVNQRRIWMAKHVLRRGDNVEVGAAAPVAEKRGSSLPVLFDDAHLLIVNKPAGLLANGPASAESRLRDQTGIMALTAAHRLDRDTSGCLLFSKTPRVGEQIIRLFEAHAITKTYHAIVLGEFPPGLQTITKPLDGRTALTRIIRLSANRTASHLKLVIDTGRTHQIRKHLAGAGHPVLGDRMYLTAALTNPVLRAVARQMLHAAQIAFTHPVTGAAVRVHAPLPGDFLHGLHSVRLT
ncbi:MAG: Ribosomal large subunit pseudouridine synthase D [Verrucomicrobia bacterium ADurb.Bin345]|nr:MAG: Ribosomal large subunit pseudouridine synthase D [Verrucomicrobia bacterium ADurb.Bin345]